MNFSTVHRIFPPALPAVLFFFAAACACAGGWQEGGGLVFPGMLGVEVEAGEMNVEIVPSDGDSVMFKAESLRPGDRVLHEPGNGVVRVRLVREAPAGTGDNPGTATLSVPAGAIVRVFTTTGHVTARDQLGDRLAVSSRAGNIAVSGYNAPLDLRTSTGSITVEKSGGAKLLSSVSGNITVLDSDGGIDASGTLGNHTYARIRGRVYIHGGTGAVEVDRVRGGLRVYTSTGPISCRNIFLIDDADFRSNSGDISAEFLNTPPGVAWELSTTTGEIVLGERKSTSVMTIRNNTDINITGRSSTGDQLYSFREYSDTSGWNPLEPGPGM